MSGLRVAVLFAGCGGSALGHRQAGDRVAYLNEIWRPALDALALNFPGAAIDERDVREVRGEDVLAAAGGDVDVLDASPPCQDFSHAGSRDLSGENAWLLHEVPRVARGARPRAVVVENVAGLAQGAARPLHYEVLLEELREAGYRARGRILDASMLGVPQARERVVVIAIREDLGVDPAEAFPAYRRRRAAMRDALPDAAAIVRLPRECADPPNLAYRVPLRWPAGAPAPTVVTGGFSGGHLSAQRKDARVELADGALREVTVEDAAALCGFPRDFRFPDGASGAARWRMVGNAVPPPMARAWARSIGRALRGG